MGSSWRVAGARSILNNQEPSIAPSLPSVQPTPCLPRNGGVCVPRLPSQAAQGGSCVGASGSPMLGGGRSVAAASLCNPSLGWRTGGMALAGGGEGGVLWGKAAPPHPGISLGSSRSGSAGGQGKPQAAGIGCCLLRLAMTLGEGQGLRSLTPSMFPSITSLFVPEAPCLSL